MARTTAPPSERAVTIPAVVTAIKEVPPAFLLVTDQAKFTPLMTLPSASRAVTRNCCVAPVSMVIASGEILISSGMVCTGVSTRTVPTWAATRTMPTLIARSSPWVVTSPKVRLLTLQATTSPLRGLPCASRTMARSCKVRPTSTWSESATIWMDPGFTPCAYIAAVTTLSKTSALLAHGVSRGVHSKTVRAPPLTRWASK